MKVMCKKNPRQTCLASVVLIFIIQSAVKFVEVKANYAVSLGVFSTSHPGNNLMDGSCCNSEEETGNCTSPCSNTAMKICLVSSGSTNCSTPLWSTIVDTRPRGLSSSVITPPFPVDTGIEIFISVFEEVGVSTKLQIDVISGVLVNRTTDDVSFPRQDYLGDNSIFSVSLNFRVVCLLNFHGQDCNTFCAATNDTSGHYTCNENDGSITCLEGYQNEITNCTECVPAMNCSAVGGFCELPGECKCLSGFSGLNCNIAPTATSIPSSSQVSPSSIASTPSSMPSTPSTPGLRNNDSGVDLNAAVGGVIGVFALLILIVILIIGVMIAIKKRRDKKSANGWFIQSNPGTQEEIVLTGVQTNLQGNGSARSHHTPEYLVVPHKQQRLTVPSSTYVTAVSTPESKRMQFPKPQPWFEEPASEDDVELPISPEDESSMTQISSVPVENMSDTVLYSDVNIPKSTHVESDNYLDEVEGELGQLQEKRDLQYTTVTFGSPTN